MMKNLDLRQVICSFDILYKTMLAVLSFCLKCDVS